MDLERLDDEVVNLVAGLLSTIPVQPSKLHPEEQVNMAEAVVRLVREKDAARAYRDLLANGERVEPDWKAAKKAYVTAPVPMRTEDFIRRIVDAAISDKLLVNQPTKED